MIIITWKKNHESPSKPDDVASTVAEALEMIDHRVRHDKTGVFEIWKRNERTGEYQLEETREF